jgi:hypothetical protein
VGKPRRRLNSFASSTGAEIRRSRGGEIRHGRPPRPAG